MLNRLADLVRLRTYANTLVQPISRVSLEALHDLLLGEQVRAQVEAALPDGTFRVAVKNQSLLLRLPFPAQAGDVLQLYVAAREPQLRFSVAAPAESPAFAASLSETARFITALLGETAKLPVTTQSRTPAPRCSPRPRRTTPRSPPNCVTRSPPAACSTNRIRRNGLPATGRSQHSCRNRRRNCRHCGPRRSTRSRICGDRGTTAADAAPGLPHLPDLPVHRDTLNVLRHQLDTLDTRQVVWNGLIWPDQPIEWEITGQGPATPDAPDEQPWRTRLRMTLPRLGAIDATLQIAARGVTIVLHAASGDAAPTLAEHQGELQQALRGAGVTPFSITVGRDETA